MESASLVVQGLVRLGKRHTTNARRSADFVAFAFDVHDASFHRFGPTKVYRLQLEQRLLREVPGSRAVGLTSQTGGDSWPGTRQGGESPALHWALSSRRPAHGTFSTIRSIHSL